MPGDGEQDSFDTIVSENRYVKIPINRKLDSFICRNSDTISHTISQCALTQWLVSVGIGLVPKLSIERFSYLATRVFSDVSTHGMGMAAYRHDVPIERICVRRCRPIGLELSIHRFIDKPIYRYIDIAFLFKTPPFVPCPLGHVFMCCYKYLSLIRPIGVVNTQFCNLRRNPAILL